MKGCANADRHILDLLLFSAGDRLRAMPANSTIAVAAMTKWHLVLAGVARILFLILNAILLVMTVKLQSLRSLEH